MTARLRRRRSLPPPWCRCQADCRGAGAKARRRRGGDPRVPERVPERWRRAVSRLAPGSSAGQHRRGRRGGRARSGERRDGGLHGTVGRRSHDVSCSALRRRRRTARSGDAPAVRRAGHPALRARAGPTARVSPARVTRYDAGRGGSARRCLAAPRVFGWRRAHKRRRPASDGAAHCSYPGSRYSGHVRQHLARMQFSFVSDTQAIPAVQNLQPLGS